MGRKFGFALQGARKAYTNCGALPLHQSMGKQKKMPNYNGQVWQPRSLRGSRGDTCAYIWIDSPLGFLTLEARKLGNHFISFCFLACGVSTIETRLRRCYADLDTLAPWWRFCLVLCFDPPYGSDGSHGCRRWSDQRLNDSTSVLTSWCFLIPSDECWSTAIKGFYPEQHAICCFFL
jgi:hypothetical protein